MRRPYSSSDTVRAAPIRIVRVVVVDVATGVDIPRIVGIATIARTQPHVDRGVQPTTCFYKGRFRYSGICLYPSHATLQ